MSSEKRPQASGSMSGPKRAPAPAVASGTLLFDGPDWNFDTLKRTYDAIETVALEDLGLNLYRTQVEVITAEQMLDAYASVGMPLMYKHWSFGKRFAQQEGLYRKGHAGLALEIVINSDPCICYVMEENSMAMQALVLAHAAMGHNHFFKNNQTFLQWTDADAILEYMAFAKSFVARCEERYGVKAVERVMDAAHALADQGIDRYGRRERPSLHKEHIRARQRQEAAREAYDDLWERTVPQRARGDAEGDDPEIAAERRSFGLPEENILYFLEKNAPFLRTWEREILRIVRNISCYFEPQKQTKIMNEGCACWVHYSIMNKLHETGRISDGAMLEFLHSHSSVIAQPDFNDKRYFGLNPYALGFAMMRDIERICVDPKDEDREWFPDIAGNGRPVETLRDAWANFRDESFILQFLSPRLMREFRIFQITDDADDPEVLVEAIHNERGYRRLRRALAKRYDPSTREPRIEVVDFNYRGDRTLVLQHSVRDGLTLDALEARRVLRHLAGLWGYPVKLREVDIDTGQLMAEFEQSS